MDNICRIERVAVSRPSASSVACQCHMRTLSCCRSVLASRPQHRRSRGRRGPAAAHASATLPPQPPSPPQEPVLRDGVTLADLRLAALRARLADHCYFDCNEDSAAAAAASPTPDAPLAALLAADGLSLVAAGRSAATRWYVADDRASDTRHVVFRGVAWRDPNVDVGALTARLASAWRAQLTPGVPVYAHAGALRCAQDLWTSVEPHVRAAVAPSSAVHKIALSGHSLGGALALLTACQCRLQWGIPPALLLPVYAFGAPPVLACDSPSTLAQLLQLRGDSMRSFVLDSDPVPLVGANASVTSRAGALLGYGHHGEVFLCRWLGASSASVARLSVPTGPPPSGDGSTQTPLATGDVSSSGDGAENLSLLTLVRQALDHNRRSYTDALAWLVTLAETQEAHARQRV